MEDEYVYTPLKNGEIRLLEILPGKPDDPLQCSLRVVSLSDEMSVSQYAALSYTWGEDLSDRSVIVNGGRLSVKPNLEAALLEFRRLPPRLPPDNQREEVIAALSSTRILGHRYFESMSETSRAKYDELEEIIQSYATSIHAAVGNDAEKIVNDAFLKDAETTWNEIAAREGIPPLYQEPVLLWIDGICVNQNDSIERNAQVQMMARIYARAKHLVVWLGSGEKGFLAALRLLEIFEASKEKNDLDLDTWFMKQLQMNDTDMGSKLFNYLYSLPWFGRAWIVQEYVLCALNTRLAADSSEPVVFCCGPRRHRDLVSKTESKSNSLLTRKSPSAKNGTSWNALRLFAMRTSYRDRRSKIQSGSESSKCGHLLKLVVQSFESRASNPRDRIYSCLGLVDAYFNEDFGDYVPNGLIVDYDTSVEDVYSSFVRAIVDATKRLDILTFCNYKVSKHVRRTWTPDWDTGEAIRGIIPSNILAYIVFGDYVSILSYDITPGVQSIAVFADDLSTITISGFIYDRLADDSSTFMRDLADIKRVERNFLEQEMHQNKQHSNSKGFIHSLRTRLQNQKGVLAAGRLKFKKILLECLKLNPEDLELQMKNFEVELDQAKDLESLIRSVVNFDEEQRNTKKDDVSRSREPVNKYVTIKSGKTLVLTEGNNIVRPFINEPRPGDLVCVILGCAMPMLLRSFNGYYELVGDVYVPGIMHGEAMTALKEGKMKLQDFELH